LADNKNFDILFDPVHRPIYFPNLFAAGNFVPNFDPWKEDNANLLIESLAFSRDDEVH
uniref:Uncharacterized protein n=1 Tax=Romanomermis culicivorax TaxID=13658 RepID=A0A915I3R2_ROMCU